MTYDEALDQLHPSDVSAVETIDAALFTGDAFFRADNRVALRTVIARWERRLTELSLSDESLGG